MHCDRGLPARAHQLLAESTQIAHRLGYQHGLVYCLNGFGLLAFECDDSERADGPSAPRCSVAARSASRHDADDVLVAHARATVEARLGSSVDAGDEPEFDLARVRRRRDPLLASSVTRCNVTTSCACQFGGQPVDVALFDQDVPDCGVLGIVMPVVLELCVVPLTDLLDPRPLQADRGWGWTD